jgi:PAS domain-containing protein
VGSAAGSEATLTPAQILAAAAALFADPEAELARIRDIIAHNRRDESRVRLHDGRVLFRRCEPALADGSPLRVWSFRDITAEEQALAAMRSREAEQRALIDGFPGNIVGLDAHGVYTHVNRRVAAVLGREPEDIVGRRLDEISAAGARGLCARCLAAPVRRRAGHVRAHGAECLGRRVHRTRDGRRHHRPPHRQASGVRVRPGHHTAQAGRTTPARQRA